MYKNDFILYVKKLHVSAIYNNRHDEHIPYLLTCLLTYSLHGAESFLRS